MQFLGLILSVAGTAVSVVNSNQEAENASTLANIEAEELRQQASEEEARVRRMNRVELARQRATLAKSGVALEGTPLDQLVRNANELEQDAVNASRGILRKEAAAVNYGRSALAAGRSQMVASLISGASSAYAGYSNYGLLRRTPPTTYSGGGPAY
jgi:hypothetical protein